MDASPVYQPRPGEREADPEDDEPDRIGNAIYVDTGSFREDSKYLSVFVMV